MWEAHSVRRQTYPGTKDVLSPHGMSAVSLLKAGVRLPH